MKSSKDEAAFERAWVRSHRIRERKAVGLWLPIVWHLAIRKYIPAMVDLASWLSDPISIQSSGRTSDAFSANGLYYRAFRARSANAAQHMAMNRFNLNDLAGYRRWLRKAAILGDAEAANELGHFETRLPHAAARRIFRHRSQRRWEKFG
jgi:hypothetical protein